jgi:hypothetical protein
VRVILPVFWALFLSRMVFWIIVGIVLVYLRLLVCFLQDTAEKHASPSPARTANHPLCTCRKFKGDMLELARTFLKPIRAPKEFAAVLDFGDPPSDSDHSEDSDSVTHELEALT